MPETKRILKGTRINLRSRNEVSSVEVTLFGPEDFIEWCKANNFEFEMRAVDSGNTLSGGRGFDVQKQFLCSNSTCFASVRSISPQEIELRSAGCLDSIQREFIKFCREACTSSWTHDVRLDGKSLDSFGSWFESLPQKLSLD